jgi:hypothetical protein
MRDVPSTTPAPVESALLPGAIVAGYRLLRQVAGAATTGAWLARPPGERETLCITVQRPSEAVERRVAAHSRISSRHVLALLDLATDADGHVVLAYERTDWTLATLLSSRAGLAPGEAVTVLAPLSAALAAIHREGLCFGGLTPATVFFCPDGRPVLGGLDALRDSGEISDDNPPPPGVRADYESLGNLIAAVAHVVDEAARPELFEISDWIETQLRDGSATRSILGQVECRLFALAPALPVVLVADRHPPGAGDTGAPRRSARLPVMSARRAIDVLPALARAAAAADRRGMGAWIQRVLRGRAFAVCLGIVLLVVTLLAGLAAIPDRAPESTTTLPEAKPSHGPARPPNAEGTATPTRADHVPVDGDAGTGEDPVAATVFLLGLRERCLNGGSAACVARYTEPASALADADAHAFGNAPQPRSLLADGAESAVKLVETYGDVALMQASNGNEKRQPVFVLAVRTDTGWRLRDLFEPD